MNVRPATRRDTRVVLLDAALETVGRVGLAKLSMGDVARSAGVTRQTAYRYFRDRDDLISALILREEEAFVAAIDAITAGPADLQEALEAVIGAVLGLAHQHPLLDPLLQSEPDALLPFLAAGRAPVVGAVRPAIERLVSSRLGHLPVNRVRVFSDALARLLLSYVVNPLEDAPDLVAPLVSHILAGGLDPG